MYGDAVHVLYAEPTAAPCCTLALASGLGSAACCAAHLGLNVTSTVADGLAVARASQLCCDMTGGRGGGGVCVCAGGGVRRLPGPVGMLQLEVLQRHSWVL